MCYKHNYEPLFIPGKVIAPDFQPLFQTDATLQSFTDSFYQTWKSDFIARRNITKAESVPLLNLQPVTDDKPFFLDLSFGIPPLLEPLLWGTLLLLAGIGGIMYFVAVKRDKYLGEETWLHPFLKVFTYFFSLGVAFMMVEIPLIQKMILILGHPTYALTVVLFFLLSGAGTGSYISGLKRWHKVKKFNRIVCLVVAIASSCLLIYLNASHELVLSLPLFWRIAWSGMLSFGLGIFLGMPFPVAMKALGKLNSRYIAWMWCINGFSSLLGSVIAAIGAKIIGFHMVFMFGCLFYLLAALCSSDNWPDFQDQ